MDEIEDRVGAEAFAAARALVGTRFRLQGNDPATGLDCVGLVWAAYAAAGVRLVRPGDYPLRGWGRPRIEAGLIAAGFAPAADRRAGDVALIAFAGGQFHLGLIGPASLVHAHAGLRRVVETPLDAAARDAALWRLWGGERTFGDPPPQGEGDHPEGGGGVRAVGRGVWASRTPPPCFAWSPSPFRGGSALSATARYPRKFFKEHI